MNLFKQIYKQIKKNNKIVIARHIGPDPDALGSTLGLKEIILNTFPKKEVYVIGAPAARHRYIGMLDKFTEDMYEDSLLIVLDTPNMIRIDGVDVNKFKYKIKIDHHPFMEKYADIELIDDSASSASQLVAELIFNTKLKLNKEAAEKFINFLCDPQVAKQNVDYIGYSTPNTAAFDLLDEETKNNPAAYPSEEELSKCTLFTDLDSETLKLYEAAFTEVLSQ